MKQILLVDDESTVRKSLAAYLEDDGLEVFEAGCAEEAIQIVERGGTPMVCIMDMRLPGIDGNDAILALHRLLPGLRFLIHTGSLSYGLSADLRAIGITEKMLFHKPLADLRILADAIRGMMTAGDTQDA